MGKEPPRRHILIVGAGLGGLSAAALLLQRGHHVRVYERAATLREIGAGIQVSANATRVLDSLGLTRAIERVAVTPSAIRFHRFDSSDVLHEVPLGDTHRREYGARYYHLHRADLHGLLADKVLELDPEAIVLERAAESFREDAHGARLEFSDGAQANGDLLVCADGIKSILRRRIVGDVPAPFTGYTAWRGVVDVERLGSDFMDRVCAAWVGSRAHAVAYYVRGGRLMNFVGIVESETWREESWTVKDSWANLKADFAGWHADVQQLIDHLPEDQCYRWALYDRPPVTGWSTERATLLGDAAHATLPFMAQGAAMAIEDGAILARALESETDLARALDRYQRTRYERTSRVQAASSHMGDVYRSPGEARLRAGLAQSALNRERDHWLYAYDPLTAPLAAPPG